MTLKLGLYCRLEQRSQICSPITGLSPLELELLLDQSLEGVEEFHKKNPEWISKNPPENRGNYFWQKNFLEGCKSVRSMIPREKYLENPHVFVERSEDGYSTRYNSQLEERIAKKLAQFKISSEHVTVPVDKLFSRHFARDRAWVVEQ